MAWPCCNNNTGRGACATTTRAVAPSRTRRVEAQLARLRRGQPVLGNLQLFFIEQVAPALRPLRGLAFELLPDFIGRGWGKHLLTRAVLSAWESGTHRVWLHTCTLDHQAALPNYLKRGFRPVREEVYEVSAAGGQRGNGAEKTD